jgi:excisionase family DNA binding protein
MARLLEEHHYKMNEPSGKHFSDSNPCVMLTTGELRQLLREELRGILSQDRAFDQTRNSLCTPQTATPPYLTVLEAADLTRLAVSTIRLYIRKGRLKAQKVGRRVILSRAEVEKFLGGKSSKVVELFPT